MKKILIITLVAMFIIGGGIYAYTLVQNKETEADTTTQSSQNTTSAAPDESSTSNTSIESAEDAVAKLKDTELTVGEDEGAFYQMIGATSGVKVDVDGSTVEIYGFDDSSALESAKTSLDGSRKIAGLLVLVHDNDELYTTIEEALED